MAGKTKKTDPGQTALTKVIDDMLPMAAVEQEIRAPRMIQGRGNPASHSLQKLARDYTADAFATVLEIMDNPLAEPSTRLEAAKVVLDRGWGKAAIQVHATQVKISIKDVEMKLLADKSYNDDKWEAARRAEDEQLGKYVIDDVEVIENLTEHSQSPLHDSEEGSRSSPSGLRAAPDEDSVSDMEASGEEIYGASGFG